MFEKVAEVDNTIYALLLLFMLVQLYFDIKKFRVDTLEKGEIIVALSKSVVYGSFAYMAASSFIPKADTSNLYKLLVFMALLSPYLLDYLVYDAVKKGKINNARLTIFVVVLLDSSAGLLAAYHNLNKLDVNNNAIYSVRNTETKLYENEISARERNKNILLADATKAGRVKMSTGTMVTTYIAANGNCSKVTGNDLEKCSDFIEKNKKYRNASDSVMQAQLSGTERIRAATSKLADIDNSNPLYERLAIFFILLALMYKLLFVSADMAISSERKARQKT